MHVIRPSTSIIMVIAVLNSSALAQASRAQDAGDEPGTRFVRLGSEQTGIAFENEIDGDHPLRHLYVHGFGGAGVCVGDYDDDGLPDIFLTGQARPSALYRQVSPWKFEDVTVESGVAFDAWDTGATFVDIDNDNDLDLYVCSYDGPNRLYVNQGDGSFVERASQWGLDYSGASIMAAFADYDRDGDLDVYIVTNRIYAPLGGGRTPRTVRINGRIELEPGFEETHALQTRRIDGEDELYIVQAGQRDLLLRNDGQRFTNLTDAAGISGFHPGLSATWWDYNADGWPDVYVGNDYWDPDFLYRNNGDGTFTNVIRQAVPCTPWFSMGADAADINNDGLIDFLVADMSATTHFMQKMTMGDMADSRWFLESAQPRQYMRNALYLNTGTSRMMEVAYLSGLDSTDWTWSVKFGDLDNDGWTDVFFTNGSLNHSFNPDFTKKQQELHERLMRTPGVTREMVDNAQWNLVRSQPNRTEANLAFRNAGDLKFENVGEAWGLGDVGLSYGAALADLDRDGDLDIVVANLDEPVGLYRNDTTDANGVLVRLRGTASNSFGIDAVLEAHSAAGTQVKQLTLARGYMSANEPIVHFGIGDAARIDRLSIRWPSGRTQVVRDLAPGRLHTIIETDEKASSASAQTDTPLFREVSSEVGLNYAHRERPFDDYSLQPLLPARHSQLGPGLAVGDVNGDGRDDVFIGGAAGQAGVLYTYDGVSFVPSPSAPWAADAACEDMAALLFDADTDGDLDLFVASGSVEVSPGSPLLNDRLYLNDGQGRFTKAVAGTLPDLRISSGCAVAADYDNDGDLDLFIGGRIIPGEYPRSPRSVLLRNDGGRFVDATDADAPGLASAGMVTGALWSDTDDDGRLDLLITVEWGPIRLFHNLGGTLVERTEDAGLAPYTGWWNGITGVDLDRDGDIDYIAVNAGLNTKYNAEPGRPTLLYYGSVDGSKEARLLEAQWEDESLYPVRGKSCCQNAMPFLQDAFPTFESFALAEMDDIYGPSTLEQARRFEVEHLESVALINDGHGRFTVRPLPRAAQASPGFGVVAADFNADGMPDVAIAQNWFGPQPETGRWAGGIGAILTGQPDGSFKPLRADASGIVIEGDAKALALCDLDNDGDADLIVSQNDGRTLVQRNLTNDEPGDRVSLAVRLVSGSEHRPVAGARVSYIGRDFTQVAEVYAGSGYLSQSSPTVFFGVDAAAGGTVVVRWPDGTTTEHLVPRGTKTMRVSRDQR